MEYKGFQRTMAFFGALLILISTALVLVSTKSTEEVVGQLLFFLVLVGALLYGKRGGIITGILSTAIYAGLHFQTLISLGPTGPALILILIRGAIYLIAGALGGEIFFRIKHFMIETGRSDFVDADTKLFNSTYFGSLIDMESKKFERYNTISSVVVFAIDKETLKLYLEEPKTPGIKYIADGVVGNVRLVDEVGRIKDNEFATILPFTPREGAEVVAKRLQGVMIGRVGYEDCVSTEIISLPADKERMDALAAELLPAE